MPISARCCAPALILLAAGWAHANPVVINLGAFPGGTGSQAWGVSADGTTVVGMAGAIVNNTQVGRGFRWVAPSGPMQMIPVPATHQATRARSVNANGTVIAGDSDGLPFRWSVSGGTVFFPLLTGGTYGWVTGVSGSGLALCGIANGNNFTLTRCVRWDSLGNSTLLAPVGPFDPNKTSYGGGISGDGTIIVGMSTDGNLYRAVRWLNNGPAQALGTIAPNKDTQANAISADGQVITGWAAAADGTGHVFRHTAMGGMVGLGKLFPNSLATIGYAISGNGSVIVGEDTDSLGNDRAIIWTATTGVMDLKTYVQNNGGNVTGWYFEYASGVSADGSVICGTGIFNGQYVGFVIRGLPCVTVGPVIDPTHSTNLCVPAGPVGQPLTSYGASTVRIDASGSEPLTYQWSVELTEPGTSVGTVMPLVGTHFSDPVSGLTFDVEGADGPQITITNYREGVAPRQIKVIGVVLNPCGQYQVPPIPIGIATCPAPCSPADVTGTGTTEQQSGPDGYLTGEDFDFFIMSFFTGLRRPGDGPLAADVTDDFGTGEPDGALTGSDFDFFIQKFFEGCP